MNSVAKNPDDNLKVLFSQVSVRCGLSPAIVEKDFWVCWMLDYLFARSPWTRQLAFKGGTSLSKAYGLIKRFSEDIDLILDWRLLGYGVREPWEDRSNTQQDLFNERANERSAAFLRDVFVPHVKSDLERELGRALDIAMDEHDPNTVVFRYPCAFSDESILREIRLESGALAAWTPAAYHAVRPYAADYYPQHFKNAETQVYTVEPERTFWEKVTILHREAMRTPERGPMPSRYSRHYYDLWCMIQAGTKDAALKKLDLLDDVVSFKRKFYRCSWARYEQATSKEIRLMPPEHALSDLKEDYRHMQNMIFGPKPPFEDILAAIQELEVEIHNCR